MFRLFGQSVSRRWGERLAVGRRARRIDASWFGLEALGQRVLLSGVTVIAHGFSGSVGGWVGELGEQIAARPELAPTGATMYTVTADDPGSSGGPINVSIGSRTGPQKCGRRRR